MKIKILLIVFILISTLRTIAAEYNIVDYGARKDQLSTGAIQQAIDACFKAGGGIVRVPTGTFITGTLFLKSYVNLYLEEGAELQSSIDMKDFEVGSSKYGMIYCEDATNISITGRGTINARGTDFYDTTQNHGINEAGEIQDDRKYTRQKENFMLPGKFFSDGPIKRKPRPGMTLVFFHCNQVRIEGIIIKDTPIWATRFGYCENVVISNISILNNLLIPNSDGIHLTVSRNVKISDCEIIAGDDAIVLTGFAKIEDTPGFTSAEQDKYKYGNKSIYGENLQVTNCRLQSRSSAIRIGYGQHPIRRCLFSNIIISDSNRGIGIFAHDSSSIEELVFSDIIIETRLHNGVWWGRGEPIHLSSMSRFKDEPVGSIRDVQFNNITSTSEQGILVYGAKENKMERIQFNNVKLFLKKGKETMDYGGNFDLRPVALPDKRLFEHDIPGLYAQHIQGLSIRNFELRWGKDLPSFFTHGIECKGVTDFLLEDFKGSCNPNSPKSLRIKLAETTQRK